METPDNKSVFQKQFIGDLSSLLNIPQQYEFKENVEKNSFVVLQKTDGHKSKLKDPDHSLTNIEKLVQNHDKRTLKFTIRAGSWPVNDDCRSQLWILLTNYYKQSRSEHILDPEYRDMPSVDTALMAKLPRKLPAFVDTGFCRHFKLNTAGQVQLDRILWQVASDHPEMTFCPLLYPLVALFLHYLDPEHAYNAVCNLVDAQIKSTSGKTHCLLPQTRTQIIKDAYVLIKLTANFGLFKQKQFYEVQRARLTKYYELDSCFLDWLKWIFVGLPFQHLVRIVDCYLVEGGKVLFRVGIAILILYKRHLNKKKTKVSDSSLNFGYRILRRFSTASTYSDPGLDLQLSKVLAFCEQLQETPDELMQLAFSISRFSSARIDAEYSAAEASMKSNHSLASLTSHVGLEELRMLRKANELITPGTVRISNRISPKCVPNSTILNWQLLDILWEWLPARLMVCEPKLLFSVAVDGNSLSTFYTKAANHEPTLLLIRTYNNEIFGAFCSSSWSNRLAMNEVGYKNKYFGTGECFLFKLQPSIAYYPWVGATDSVKSYGQSHQPIKTGKISNSNANESNIRNDYEDSLLSHSNSSEDMGFFKLSSSPRHFTEMEAQKPLPHNCQLFMCGERKYICVGSGSGDALWLDENLTRGRTERCLTFENEPLSENMDFICINCELIGFE